jgi:hypothetical protein
VNIVAAAINQKTPKITVKRYKSSDPPTKTKRQ